MMEARILTIRQKLLKLRELDAKLWLTIFFLFFLATRLYQINSNPPSLYWDEASIGYNSYSILQTGKDEWGESFPVHFRAFGEFKLPVYIYSAVLTEAIFGLTPLGIRLPAVLFSLGSLILIYFLIKKITQRKLPALLSAFIFSVSPWMFIFSRTGYEATAGLFFFLLAIYFFLLSQLNKIYFLLFSVSLIFSIYSYNSFRILSILMFVAGLVYTLRTNHSKKTVITSFLAVLIFAVSFIPILRLYLLDSGLDRASILAITPTKTNNLSSFLNIGSNYISHYSPQFLFQGDQNPRSQQPEFGQIYYPDLILIILGFFFLLKLRKFYAGLIILLLLIAPIPASFFRESPHSLRSVLMAPILAILSAFGIWWIVEKRKNLLLPILVAYFSFFGFYYFIFLKTYPQKTSADWQYGYKQIYTNFSDRFSDYDNIIISDDYAQPYIFLLTYLKVDPTDFQKNAVRNPVNDWGFSTVKSFNKFHFIKENSDLDYPGASLVFMTKPLGNKLPARQIYFLNGQPALFVYIIEKDAN